MFQTLIHTHTRIYTQLSNDFQLKQLLQQQLINEREKKTHINIFQKRNGRLQKETWQILRKDVTT